MIHKKFRAHIFELLLKKKEYILLAPNKILQLQKQDFADVKFSFSSTNLQKPKEDKQYFKSSRFSIPLHKY